MEDPELQQDTAWKDDLYVEFEGSYRCLFVYHEGFQCEKAAGTIKTITKHIRLTHSPCDKVLPDGRACQRHEGECHDHTALAKGLMPLNAYPGTASINGMGTVHFTPVFCFVCGEDQPPFFKWSLVGLVSEAGS
ncbi:hypothetical protein QFC24_000504 [Naganishia onofrii]|uniref:Uncharacterized protein n=1 Tax=Naganishia onofrii TaxID=1851511 RepID=A0ACC2XW57_9TREE|nr:hypothetical protein QFC24_000504 [Naganishia onofrii]